MEKFAHKNIKAGKILFILGNGFDLNLGMKTSYENAYDVYIDEPSKSEVIEKFKQELKNDKKLKYENWSDFETMMAKYACKLNSEEELIECVRDFKRCMVAHLTNENGEINKIINTFENHSMISEELKESLMNFHKGFIPNVRKKINKIIENSHVSTDVNFITFNYTNAIEMLLQSRKKYYDSDYNLPIHIHGKLDENVVLGVDNTEQLKTKYAIGKKGKRAFVKTLFNEEYDPDIVKQAKNTVNESDVICVFGFSMGETDKTWVDLLINWLQQNPEHQLVVFDQYSSKKFDKYNFDEIMDAEEEKKEELLKRFGLNDEKFYDQMHIAIGHSIFQFKNKFIKPSSVVNQRGRSPQTALVG